MPLIHSQEFIARFVSVLQKTYNYELYMDFVVIPSLFSKPKLSYVPLLSYSDKYSSEINDLKELAKENEYLIRVINPDYTDYKEGDTVTMRVTLESNTEDYLMSVLTKKCRTKIRKTYKDFHYTLQNGRECIEDFYTILQKTYKNHGTPLMPKELFYNLYDEFQENMLFCVVYDEHKTAAATMAVCIDNNLAYCPWGGVEAAFSKNFAGYFLYFEVLKTVAQQYNVEVVDFGRSPYEGATYKFKKQFGCTPYKIDLIKSNNDDIYEKYQFASTLWKKLPCSITNTIGPKLTKYLVDL